MKILGADTPEDIDQWPSPADLFPNPAQKPLPKHIYYLDRDDIKQLLNGESVDIITKQKVHVQILLDDEHAQDFRSEEQKPYWDKVKDQMCRCGALKSEHVGFQNHGGCIATRCEKFFWVSNVLEE